MTILQYFWPKTHKNSPHELSQLKSFIIIINVQRRRTILSSREQKQLLIHLSKHADETQAVTLRSFYVFCVLWQRTSLLSKKKLKNGLNNWQ